MDIARLLREEERSSIEAYVRSQVRVVPAGESRVLARVLDSFLLYLDMRDTSIAPHLAMDGYWEMWATIAVARYVKSGMCCIDVGASFGYYTMLLARLVGEGGYVQAWEPLPEAYGCLRDSVSVSGASGIVGVAALAAGEALDPGGSICLPGSRWGDTSFKRAGKAHIVGVDQIDAHFAGQAHFIKVDVEGFEASVWEGMRETLKRSPNVQIMLEFTPEDHARPEAFLDRVSADGFGVRAVAANGDLAPISREQALEPGVKLLWLAR